MTDAERYDVVLSPGARRALTDLLPPPVAFACWEFSTGPLRENPRIVGAPLREPFAGLWRAQGPVTSAFGADVTDVTGVL